MDDQFYMEFALKQAEAMRGQTDPNPLVGAVIVNGGRIVGHGAHLRAGGPHAEIHALRMAGEQAKGATVYVTLEPCSHHGRTGPCAMALAEAGVKRAVIATLDPNPLVAGKGISILKEAGIDVTVGICEKQSRKMNEVFNKFIVQKKPFITLKTGSTLDGKIATYENSSKWITSQESRIDAHRLRSEHGAILVGIQTVIHDDPELTSRISNGRNPIRIVLDSKLKIPLRAKLVSDGKADTWIFTGKDYDEDKRRMLEDRGIRVFPTKGSRYVDLSEVVHILGEQLVSSVLVEGGGTVNAAFLENGLVDKVVIYMAPKLVGGKSAPTFFEGTGIAQMSDAIELEDLSVEPVGKDFKVTGYPVFA